MTGSTGGGDELIHDATVDANPLVLRALCDQRHRAGIPRDSAHRGEGPRHRHLERGARRQAGADRHVAGNDSLPCQRVQPLLLQGPRDTMQILDPPAAMSIVADDEARVLGKIERVYDDAPIGSDPGRDPDLSIDCHWKNEPLVVIGVIADEVHASGRASADGRHAAQPVLELAEHARTQDVAHDRLAFT